MKKLPFRYLEVITYLAILLGIIFVGMRTFYPRQYHQSVKKQLYVVLTDSMAPTISPLSVVVVDRKSQDFNEGDIITFSIDINNDGRKDLVTHRLDSIADNHIKTRSDKTNKIDYWIVDKKDILGKVVFVIPYLGYLILGVQKVAIPLLLLAMLLIMILLFQTMNRWNKL